MITIVSGLPCSGKTFMLQMLAAGGMPVLSDHAMQSETDNPHSWPSQDKSGKRSKASNWLASAEGKACEIHSSGLLDLPASHEYRIIFMLRDIDEVLAALTDTMTGKSEATAMPLEVMRYHYERHLHRLRRLLDGPRRFATCYCDYNETIDQPLLVARQVTAFLGLRLNTNAMASVAVNSPYRNRLRTGDM